MQIANKKSILEMAMGSIAEVVDREVDRVICNVMDANTKATAKRKIVLTLTFEPDETRGRLDLDVQAKSTLAPIVPIKTALCITRGQMLTDWLDVVAWERLGEFVCQYFQKGQMIAVTGRLQSRSYQDRNGNNRTAVEIVANSLDFVGSKAAANTQQGAGYAAPVQRPADTHEPKLTGEGDYDFAVIEDDGDLPF